MGSETDENYPIIIRRYKLCELASIYNCHRDTMRDWLRPLAEKIGERRGHYYSVKQVKVISLFLGPPP